MADDTTSTKKERWFPVPQVSVGSGIAIVATLVVLLAGGFLLQDIANNPDGWIPIIALALAAAGLWVAVLTTPRLQRNGWFWIGIVFTFVALLLELI